MEIKKITKRLLTLLLASLALTLAVSAGTTFAGTCYWVGAADTNWSVPGNWSSSSGGGGGTCDAGTVPTSGDVANFDSSGNTNANMDVASVGILNMSAGYNQTVTGTYAGTTTFASTVTISDGTFNAGTNTMDHNQRVTVSGGTYDAHTATMEMHSLRINNSGSSVFFESATSATFVNLSNTYKSIELTAGSFSAPQDGTMSLDDSLHVYSGSTFDLNGAGIEFTGAYSPTIYDTLGVSFNDLTLNKSGGSLGLSSTITVTGDLNLQDGVINNNTLHATGTVTWGSGFDGGTTNLSLETTAPVSINSAVLPPLIINTTQVVSTTVSAAGTTLNIQAGTFTVGDGTTFTLSSTHTQTGGTFNAGNGTIDHNQRATISGGTYDGQTATMDLHSLLISGASAIVDFDSVTSLEIVNEGNSYKSIELTTGGSFTAPLDGTLILDDGLSISGGTTFNLNGADIEFTGAYANTISDGLGVTFNDLTINKSDNYLQLLSTITVGGDLSLQDGLLNSGTLHATGTVTWGSGFDGGTTYLSLETTAPVSINTDTCMNLIVNTTQVVTTTVSATCPTLNIQAGTFTVGDATTLTVSGTYTQTGGTFNGGNGTIDHNQRATISGGTYDSQTATMELHSLLINGAGASTFFASATSLEIVNEGNTYKSIELTAGSFTAPLDGTLILDDGLSISSGTTFNLNGADIVFTGAYVITISDGLGATFYDITINKSASYVSLSSNINIDGNLSIIDGELIGNFRTVNLAGDWSVTGTGVFTKGTSTINMDGTNQTIYGDNSASFYNFSKVVTSPDTLYFDAGETQTFDGTLTLTGTSGNLLALKSTGYDTNTVASINPTGTINIDYVSVEDVNNISAITPDIDLSLNTENIDLGAANTGWTFDAAYVPPLIPEFSTYMLLITFLIGMGMIQQKFRPELKKYKTNST